MNKVPQITFAFWVRKICATTLGKMAGDQLWGSATPRTRHSLSPSCFAFCRFGVSAFGSLSVNDVRTSKVELFY
jgi:hypothetical protein